MSANKNNTVAMGTHPSSLSCPAPSLLTGIPGSPGSGKWVAPLGGGGGGGGDMRVQHKSEHKNKSPGESNRKFQLKSGKQKDEDEQSSIISTK